MNIASSEGVLNLYFIPNLCITLFLNFNVVPSRFFEYYSEEIQLLLIQIKFNINKNVYLCISVSLYFCISVFLCNSLYRLCSTVVLWAH